MLQSTVTAKGQTTLPRLVREALSVGPGDRVRYIVDDNGVRLVKAQPVARPAGMLKHHGTVVTLEAMDEAIASAAADRYTER